MAIELDHFFILTTPGAPEADLLSSIGWLEGPRNHHPGQGTANRRFFFPNTALELIYISDADEAKNGPGNGLRAVDRAMDSGASPFGVIVRSNNKSSDAPFPGWRYCPEYFRADQCFHVGANSDLLIEPSCICMPHNLPIADAQLREANSDMTLTELRISVPVTEPSETLRIIADCDLVSIRPNEPHRMELIFNEGAEGESRDMAPGLPLVIRW